MSICLEAIRIIFIINENFYHKQKTNLTLKFLPFNVASHDSTLKKSLVLMLWRRFFTVVCPQDRLFIVEMYIHTHSYIYKLCV